MVGSPVRQGQGLEQDLTAIEQAAEHYFAAHEAWEKKNMHVRFSDALQNYLPVFMAFSSELEALQLTSPQGEYAKCKLQGLMSTHLQETQERLGKFRDKEITLDAYYHSDHFSSRATRPDATDRLNYVKEITYKRIVYARTLTDEQAQKALEDECHGPLALTTGQEVSPAEALTPSVAKAVIAAVLPSSTVPVRR